MGGEGESQRWIKSMIAAPVDWRESFRAQPGMKQFHESFGQAFGFFVEACADVEGFGLEDEGAVVVEDAIAEVEADAFGGRGPEFDGEEVVVAGRGFVAKAAFDDGENEVLFLPLAESRAEVAEKLTAGGFE